MWPFSRRPGKESLQSYKKVTILGMRFIIRRLSPLADFDMGRMPQIFSDTTRQKAPDTSDAAIKRALDDMKSVVQAGVVDPPLAGSGKPGLNVDDVFRDIQLGKLLYFAILEHSLFKVKPWQAPFFFLGKLLMRFILRLRPTAFDLTNLPSREKVSA